MKILVYGFAYFHFSLINDFGAKLKSYKDKCEQWCLEIDILYMRYIVSRLSFLKIKVSLQALKKTASVLTMTWS